MPYRREQFENGEFYHVLNRRQNKNPLFTDERSFLRFLTTALVINNTRASYRLNEWSNNRMRNVLCDINELPESWKKRDNPFVNIHKVILMETHVHFLLEQVLEGGIQKFVGRLSNSYGKFLNTRSDQKGRVFEGRFKARHIDSDRYLRYIIGYIPLNALDTAGIKWRNVSLEEDWGRVKNILDSYPWSSYHTYMNRPQFDALISKDGFVRELFPSSEKFERHLRSWSGNDYLDIEPLA